MSELRNEIFSSINEIDCCVLESTVSVYKALAVEFDKAMVLLEYCDDTTGVFQEGEIIDKATGKGNDENIIEKIIAFIPRLFMAIIQQISGFIKGDKSEKDEKVAEETKDECVATINNTNDPEGIANRTNKLTNGEVVFNIETRKFSLSNALLRGFKGIFIMRSLISIIEKIKNLITRKDAFSLIKSTPFKELTEDMKRVLHDEKVIDEETKELTADVIRDALKTATKNAKILKPLCKEVSFQLQGIAKKLKNENKKAELMEVKGMLDQFVETTKYIKFTSRFVRTFDVLFMDIPISFSKKKRAAAQRGIDKVVDAGLNVTGLYGTGRRKSMKEHKAEKIAQQQAEEEKRRKKRNKN